MPRIPQQTLQQIITSTDLLEIASSRISLKARGTQHWACCPFHQEKTASFSINAEKQFYYCFGCGAKGNVIDFLMQYDRLDFLETVQMLAEQNGISIDRTQSSEPQVDRKPLYACMQAATDYFIQQLRDSQQVIDYLKQRGINGRTAKKYAIGYALGGKQNLRQALNEDEAHLLATGLAKISHNKNNELYELFYQRIMFPIRDVRGRVIAFGGRVVSEQQQPKYLNSPETALFHKSDEIYGLYEALQTKRQLNYLVLAEGYMDVVMLSQCGESQAVATLGTAVSVSHFKKLFRYTDHVICCFDGDSAGQKATWKALQSVLPLMQTKRRVSFIHLAEKQDPDSFILQNGLAAWQKLIKQAEPLSTFLFKRLQQEHSLEHLDDKARFVHQADLLLQTVPGGLFKNLLLQQLSKLTGISSAQLEDSKQQAEAATGHPATISKINFASSSATAKLDHVERCIGLLLQHPQLAHTVTELDKLEQLQLENADLLIEIIRFCHDNEQPTIGQLLAHGQQDTETKNMLIRASFAYQTFSIEASEQEFSHAIQKLKQHTDQCSIEQLLQLAKQNKLTSAQKDQLQQLIRNKNQLDVAQ